ncbi:MAG: hypothetical protein MUF25_29310 [Pirellulaceae bacterium]|nr:hypothetical protein [Pirellulaceae bacterium]
MFAEQGDVPRVDLPRGSGQIAGFQAYVGQWLGPRVDDDPQRLVLVACGGDLG